MPGKMGFPEHQSFVLEIMIDWLQSLKHFFINVLFHILIDFPINKLYLVSKIVREFDQEIPQSQTADNSVAPRGRAAQPYFELQL